MSKSLTTTDNQENKELKITEGNIKLSTSIEENLSKWFWLIEFLYSNPNKFPEVKDQYSNEILKISQSKWIWIWVQNTIQLFTILNESMLWAKLVDYNKNFRLDDLFDYNNPIILIWIIAWLSKQKLNYSSKINVLNSYLSHADEEDIYKLLSTLEKLDKKDILFKPFIKELVLFTIRHIETNITIKEKKQKNIEASKLFYWEDSTHWEFDYHQNMWSAWEYVDMEAFVKDVDDGYFSTTDYSDEIDNVFWTWDDWLRFKELDDIFEWIQEDSPIYNLLIVIKNNYSNIYNQIILEIRNFSHDTYWDKNTTATSAVSRLVHWVINDYIWEWKIEETRNKTIWFLLGNSSYSSGTYDKVIKLITWTSNQDDDNYNGDEDLFIDWEL